MRSIILAFGALCALGAGGALAETSSMRRAGELEWKAAPASLPGGAEVAVLFGDPHNSGPFVLRLRAPAGYQVPAHKHPDMETVTVMAGAVRFGEGQHIDPHAEKFLHAGDFFSATPGMGHWFVVNEDVVLQVTGEGPWKIEYFDPRYDPRQKGASSG
ncbi:MAG TPA: cupin domain-containing protein [Methylocystis sp.]|jgi:quercetin dioxygenase-like cupin family protein